MSFNFAAASGKVTFAPQTFDVFWDGQSRAKATFGVECFSTAATYSAYAYQIFETTRIEVCPFNTNSLFYEFKGDRYSFFEPQNTACVRLFRADIPLSTTAANGSVSVLFSTLTYTPAVYAWKLVSQKQNDTEVLVTGRITPSGFNPYTKTQPTNAIVSGITAGGCS